VVCGAVPSTPIASGSVSGLVKYLVVSQGTHTHQVSFPDNQKLQMPSVATPAVHMPSLAEAEPEGVILISDDEKCKNDDGDDGDDEYIKTMTVR
jgi:hypothetical protein